MRTKTYTAKLSKASHLKLSEFFNQLTILYNCALQDRKDAYEKHKKSISLYDQMKSLTEIRKNEDWFQEIRCDLQRSALIGLDKAYKRFFYLEGLLDSSL